jgi:hypothetical protein
MPKTLTGAALKANRRRVLIDTARADMTTGHPDGIVALLEQAEKARPTRNPEPLRPELRDAVQAEDDEFIARVARFVRSGVDDDASHTAEERRHAGIRHEQAEDEGADLPVDLADPDYDGPWDSRQMIPKGAQ